MVTNEEIARAAGLEMPHKDNDYSANRKIWRPMVNGRCRYIGPNWPADPGAVATWLLPVLEKRWPMLEFNRDKHHDLERWIVYENHESDGECCFDCAPTWHEAVIAGILATREDK